MNMRHGSVSALLFLCLVLSMAHAREVHLGIDVGVTNSRVGLWREEGIQLIPDEKGQRHVPSVVAFTNQGQALVGEVAKSQALLHPNTTLFGFTTLLGKRFDEVDTESFPFKLVNKRNKPHVSINLQASFLEEREAEGGRKDGIGLELVLSMEEVTAILLSKLKDMAAVYLQQEEQRAERRDEEEKVDYYAVIAVPYHWDDAQRFALKDAATIAGLRVERLVSAPMMAAVSHDFLSELKTILVVDLGGSSLDVSLLEMDGGVFEVLASRREVGLGGDAFDERLLKHVLKEFQSKTGVDCSGDRGAMQWLKEAVEGGKKELSREGQTSLQLYHFFQGHSLEETLTRHAFEELNADLFEKIVSVVEQVLEDAAFQQAEQGRSIDHVILVGGSSHIPKVQQLLKELTYKEPTHQNKKNDSIPPEDAIVYGAILQASINQRPSPPCLVIMGLSSLTVGIETMGGLMTPMVERHSFHPVKRTRIFSTARDNQESVLIRVFEGERALAKDNHFVGTVQVKGIPPAPRGVPKIQVTMEFDFNSFLHVSAVLLQDDDANKYGLVTASETKNDPVVLLENIMNEEDKGEKPKSFYSLNFEGQPEEIDKRLQEAEEAMEEDQKLRESITARNKLEHTIYLLQRQLNGKPEARQLEKVKRWLAENENARLEREEYEKLQKKLEGLFL
ncbi:ATPase with role in protein import into the ER [Balamuthia mandrillaris]